MSGQYLEAHTFLKTLRDKGVPYTETLVNLMQYAVIEEVAPVVHAHWETDNYGYAILNEEGHTLYLAGVPCSRCHVTGKTNWNYCPNCGAKMDEEVNDA